MGRKQEQEGPRPQQSKSLRSKAAHYVSDITNVLLNPISDKTSSPPSVSSAHDDLVNSENHRADAEEDPTNSVNGPDTSSFSAFLYSFLAEPHSNSDKKFDTHGDKFKQSSEPIITKKKSLFSRGKHSLGKAFFQAAKIGGFRNQGPRGDFDMSIGSGSNSKAPREDEGVSMQTLNESPSSEMSLDNLPETSEPSLLLSEKTRSVLYAELPVIVQGRKWMLLYSTWRHGISLSTLYRRSMIWPGLSLLDAALRRRRYLQVERREYFSCDLVTQKCRAYGPRTKKAIKVVGDRNGAVFGGLVEAPLKPTSKRRYQGSNNSFIFTNISGHPLIFRPTGMNRYFTLCSTGYLAMGGGGHFALYLDEDLLSGSSSSSETYGNPCLARSVNFEVKEVELWGFVYASKYEEMIALSRTEATGICHW
ncbi:hypothetical protein OROHE_000440 [Orobanche hederae]